MESQNHNHIEQNHKPSKVITYTFMKVKGGGEALSKAFTKDDEV
jgi:hypothetical protein